MEFKKIEKGIIVFNKEDGKQYTVTDVSADKVQLTEFVPEEDITEDTVLASAVMTEKTAPIFRFLKNPNPYTVPEAEMKKGALIVNGETVATGQIKPVEIVATMPGKVIFSVKGHDDLLDIKAYMPREDVFIDVINDVSEQAEYHVEDGILYILDNQTKMVEKKDADGKVILDDAGEPVMVNLFNVSFLAAYKNGFISNGLVADDDDDWEDDEDRITYFQFPVEWMQLTDFANRKTVMLTSTVVVRNGIIEERDDETAVLLVPVDTYNQGGLRTPNSYVVSGTVKKIIPSVSPENCISFSIFTDKSVTYTNAGHRKRVVEDAAIATEIADFPIFLGIRFARGGKECTLVYGNHEGDIREILIKNTQDRGDVYSITTR